MNSKWRFKIQSNGALKMGGENMSKSKLMSSLIFVILLVSIFIFVYLLPTFLPENTLFFNWMNVPVFSVIMLNFIGLILVVVYTSYYWPYRKEQ